MFDRVLSIHLTLHKKMKFSILNVFSKYDHIRSFLQIYEDDTAQEMKFSIKYFFSKRDQIRSNCGFGHIYWRNPQLKTLFIGQCLF